MVIFLNRMNVPEISPYLVEKLYRRYLVTYYSPLFDVYHQEEVRNIIKNETNSEEEWKSEVEIIIEEPNQNLDILPKILHTIYKKRINLAFNEISFYSQSVKKATETFNILENILSFNNSYLIDSDKGILSKFGKGITKNALNKMMNFSKLAK